MANAAADRSGHGSIARYRSVFTQVAVGIAYTTTDGRILEANAKLCEMLGYSREELLRQFPDYRIHLYREAMINHAATAGPGRGILMSEVMSLVAQKPFD